MSAGTVAYSARADATRDGEMAALGAVYGFVLRRHAERNAAEPNDGEGPRKEPDGVSREERTAKAAS